MGLIRRLRGCPNVPARSPLRPRVRAFRKAPVSPSIAVSPAHVGACGESRDGCIHQLPLGRGGINLACVSLRTTGSSLRFC